MEATLVAPSTTLSHTATTTHQVTGIVPNPFPRDLIPQRAPAYTLHDNSSAALQLIRTHTGPSATTHSPDAAGDETHAPQDTLIEVTAGHDIGQDVSTIQSPAPLTNANPGFSSARGRRRQAVFRKPSRILSFGVAQALPCSRRRRWLNAPHDAQRPFA